MAQNLLLNPGFEADWSEQKSHQAHIFKADGSDYFRDVENIHTPPDWTSWFYHDPQAGNDGYDQPEIRDAWKQNDKRRVHDGEKAILLFTFCRRHDAGFYQQVDVEPGQRLRFTAWAHAWSNSLEEFHHHDGRWSEGAGWDVVAWPVSDGLPYDTDDPQTDAKPNFAFWVGIDPIGGVNPHADSVVWGDGYHIYNGHCHELSVEATAQGDVVTVFLRSKTLWAFTHNDAYWDNAALVAVDDPDPPPDPPDPPDPPEPERGAPRVQYERTYILLPPSANSEWALAAIGATWDKSRFTVGASADDSAVGDLTVRNIIAVNAAEWPTDLAEFYAEWYSGVSVQYLQADTPEQLARLLSLPGPQPPTACLCQRDARWEDERLAGSDCSEVIGDKGCYLCGLAEAQRHYGIDYGATPVTVRDALLPDGFSVCDVRRSMCAELCGMTNTIVSTAEADTWLADGNCAMIEVQPTSLQHFVLAVGRMESGDYIVANPWTGEVGPLAGMYSGVESWRKLEPVGVTPEPPAHPIVGTHDLGGADWMLQNGIQGWCCESVYLDGGPRTLDLQRYADAGIRVILRLNWSYARDDGGQGTVPLGPQMIEWEDNVVETMRRSPAAWGHVISNEMNNPREWPNEAYLSPDTYAVSYNRIHGRKPDGARMSPGAIDPTNAGWGDWRKTWPLVLESLDGADFLALHAYDHGPNADRDMIFGDDPLQGAFYNLRMLESQTAIIPAGLAGLPIVITETNHLYRGTNEHDQGWEDNGGEWLKGALEYFKGQDVAGVCVYRWGYDQWAYEENGSVKSAIQSYG